MKLHTRKHKKNILPLLLLITLLFPILTGCSARDNRQAATAEESKDTSPTAEGIDGRGNLVPVATISALNLQIMPAYSNTQLLRQDKMYTSAYRYDKDTELLSVIFYRQNLLEDESATELWSRTGEGWRSDCFTADLQGNYYILEGLNEGQGNFLRLSKYNQHQEEIFRKDYPDTAISIRDGADITGIVASEEGSLCFYSAEGLLIFCDEHGDIKSCQKLDATGVEGIALGPQEKAVAFSWSEEKIDLYQINLKDGTIKEGGPCASYPSSTFYPETCVYSGYEEGIFITTREGLWRYQPETNESSQLFKWNESRLNLDGNLVRGFSRLENGNYFALLWNSSGFVGEQVEIALLEESTLPERKVITLGIPRENYMVTENYIKQFNRQSKEWEVKPVKYGDPDRHGSDAVLDGITQLNLALADGNGPDLIDLSRISAEGMAANGFLEDLEGYFQKSQTVSKDNILEQIWQAGMVNGKITGIIPCFSISTLISKNPEQKAGWTVEEAFSMSKGNDWDCSFAHKMQIIFI